MDAVLRFFWLLQIKSPFIEDFLKYTATLQHDSSRILGLLWRYYEKIKNYLPAARILDQLAHKDRCMQPSSCTVRLCM